MLISRVTGQPLPEFLTERIFGPLGMVDTGFEVPAAKRGRFTSFYRPGDDGSLELADGPDGEWSSLPALPLGNGGLASTADDWLAFCRMLLAGGVAADGRRVLSADSVRMMTTGHTNPEQRDIGRLFLEGQGWGFGGSVDIDRTNPWNTPGRIRLGRRHGHGGAHHPGHGCGHHPADSGSSDGSRADAGDQGVLAVRGGRLTHASHARCLTVSPPDWVAKSDHNAWLLRPAKRSC